MKTRHEAPASGPTEPESARSLQAALDGLGTPVGARGNPPPDLARRLSKFEGATTAEIVAAVGGRAPAVRDRLKAMAAARVLRHRKATDRWAVRREGDESRAVRMLLGEAPVPPPRPFLGDSPNPSLPPQPLGPSVTDRTRGDAIVLVTHGGRLEGRFGAPSALAAALEEEEHEELAEMIAALDCRRIAFIDEVKVDRSVRGRGAGRALMIAALRLAESGGACSSYLIAHPLDESTTESDLDDFYRDVGMRFVDEYDGMNVYEFAHAPR